MMQIRSTNHHHLRRFTWRKGVCCFLLMVVVTLTLPLIVYMVYQRPNTIRQTSYLSQSTYRCAPWLTTPQQRKVALLDLTTMADYYNPRRHIYRGGEFYMAASLEYALRENGFVVEKISVRSLQQQQQQRDGGTTTQGGFDRVISKYHRIFANGYDPWIQLNITSHLFTSSSSSSSVPTPLPTTPSQFCKLRSIHWWGNANEHWWNRNNNNNDASEMAQQQQMESAVPFHPKQWLKPYPTADYYDTFLGFFPHSLVVFVPPRTVRQQRHDMLPPTATQTWVQSSVSNDTKVGLLFGKVAKSFRHARPIIDALLDDGFELHTTCQDCTTSTLPVQVIRHDHVGPFDFIRILRQCTFLIGFGHPYDSPSPLEALANGVAFINPIAVGALPLNETTFPYRTGPVQLRSTQHVPLSMLGAPYVYNVHLSNVTQVLAAANHAVRYRFASHVPPEYHPIAHIARVCAILEDDSLCQCSSNSNSAADTTSHCHGSSTIRKPTTGNDANGVGNVSFYHR
jgi:Glycosyltransferase family 18